MREGTAKREVSNEACVIPRNQRDLWLAMKALALKQAFLLGPLARQLAGTTHRFSLFTSPAFRGFLEIFPHFHFAKDALALQFLFQSAKRLIHVIVANTDLYQWSSPSKFAEIKAALAEFR